MVFGRFKQKNEQEKKSSEKQQDPAQDASQEKRNITEKVLEGQQLLKGETSTKTREWIEPIKVPRKKRILEEVSECDRLICKEMVDFLEQRIANDPTDGYAVYEYALARKVYETSMQQDKPVEVEVIKMIKKLLDQAELLCPTMCGRVCTHKVDVMMRFECEPSNYKAIETSIKFAMEKDTDNKNFLTKCLIDLYMLSSRYKEALELLTSMDTTTAKKNTINHRDPIFEADAMTFYRAHCHYALGNPSAAQEILKSLQRSGSHLTNPSILFSDVAFLVPLNA